MPYSAKPRKLRLAPTAESASLRLLGTSWLSDRSLLCVVSHGAEVARFDTGRLLREDFATELHVVSRRHPRDEREGGAGGASSLVHLRGDRAVRDGRAFGLNLSAGAGSWRIDARSVAKAATDLRSLIRNQFTNLQAAERAEVVRFLATSNGASGDPADQLRESRSLHVVREMLRERLPRCELSANKLEGLSVEAMVAVSESSFYVEGWICDVESAAVRLTAVSPEGTRVELISQLFRYDRPDVQAFFKPTIGDQATAKCGFIGYFQLDAPSRLPNGWLVEMETAAGTVMETAAPPLIASDDRIRAKLLGDLVHDSEDHELRRVHISPALAVVQSERAARIMVERVASFGQEPPDPAVSIVVPLYGRIDLMEHQVVQFAGDPDLRRAELIYVLDSPELKEELVAKAERLFRLYGVPYRILILSENAGFSLANNIAASCARGQLLLLLNSDVLPKERGWLSRMVAFYESLEEPGAVGPMLLYEDDSLQHAGLYFERPTEARTWTNEHYFKGLHSELPAANVARQVPAVTAACLMVDADLFHAVGGLSGGYVQGDYEDSDLCMRLWKAGRKNWYLPQVRLYHLEAQSYPSKAREMNRQYNRWLFNETWSDVIEEINWVFAPPVSITSDRRERPRKARQKVPVDHTVGVAETASEPVEMWRQR